MTKKRRWNVEGFDGVAKVFEADVPLSHLSERQMEEVLKRLLCRNLTDREIVDASINRRGLPSSLLEIHYSKKPPLTITCGTNPHYVARIKDS